MQNYRTGLSILCLSLVAASAHAQLDDRVSAWNDISFRVTGSNGATFQTPYTYSVDSDAMGHASVYSYLSSGYSISGGGSYSAYLFTVNQAEAGPGAGYARQSFGYEEYITITNKSRGNENFSITDMVRGIADETAVQYSGFSEFSGGMYVASPSYSFFGYFNALMQGYYPAYYYAFGFGVDSFTTGGGYAYALASASFSGTISSGASVGIRFWTYGYATEGRPFTSSAPAPAAVAPFAIGLVGAIRRRRK